MHNALRRLFNLHPGEGRGASLFLILGFLWSFGAFGGLTLSEGMFLEHLGAKNLPTSYLVTASSLCLLSTILLFALHRLSIPHLLFSVILGVIFIDLTLYLFLSTGFSGKTLWYLFKVIGWISPIAIYICFWAFIDQYYDLQDAKRCFCLFNSVLYLGDACGGAVISYLLESVKVSGLLFFFTLSLTASLPLIYLIVKRRKTVSEESSDGNPPQSSQTLMILLRKIVSSPFTLILMLFYFLMQLIAITTEYTYMDSFEKAFALSPHPHTLTEFLGKLAMWVSLGNMFFGLFFYSRTVTRIGVNNIILIAPLFFLSIFFSWSWVETLFFAILAIVAREGMTYTFDDNNLLLLISGVPTKIKNQVRIVIESFFEPIGMLIGASLLFILQNQSKLLGFCLAIIAIVVAFLLRSSYAKAIFENLMAHSIRFEKKTIDWMDKLSKKEKKKIEIDLFANLKKNDETLQLLAAEYLLKMENPNLLPRLLNQAARFSIRGKLHVIELLSSSPFAHENIVVERLEQWRKMLPHTQLRVTIAFYFAKHRLVRCEDMIQHIDSEHLTLRGAAILTLRTFPEKMAHRLLALEKLHSLLHSNDHNEIVMGLMILAAEKRGDNLKELLPYLKHPSIIVTKWASRAIAASSDPTWHIFGYDLIQHLSETRDYEVQLRCFEAIKKMEKLELIEPLIRNSQNFGGRLAHLVEGFVLSLGKEILPVVLTLTQDCNLSPRCRLLAAKILSQLSPSDLKLNLIELVSTEIERAHFYLFHSKNLSSPLGHHDLSILENAMMTSYKETLKFAIQLIALGGSLQECEVVTSAIYSRNRKIRAHAIETLEKSADPLLFGQLMALLDEKVAVYLKKEEKALNLETLLKRLERSPSHANRIVSQTLQEKMKGAYT